LKKVRDRVRKCDVCGEDVYLDGFGWVILATGQLVHRPSWGGQGKNCHKVLLERGKVKEEEGDFLDWL
tara:strand:+ start:723 stop:926 length:204 start_codon:yes stop_codon:yes gene_type:complete